MMSAESVINIKGFQGVNLREDPGSIKDSELTSCVNFDLGRNGELTKRTGFESLSAGLLGSNAVKLIGHFYTATYSQILARIGANLYYSNDGISWTPIGAYAVEYGVQYADKFLMVRRGGTVLVWTGTGTPTAVTGSPGGDFCIIHKERLFVFDSTGTGQPNSRVYFSAVVVAGVPQTPDMSTAWVSTNTIDISVGDGDFLVGGAIVHDLLVIFKSRTSWGIYVQGTSTGDWVVRNLDPKIGCVSKYTIKSIEGIIYFVGSTGIYRTDGTSFKSISDDLLPVLKDRVVNITNANIDQAFFWNDVYLVMLQPSPSVIRYFAYYIRINGWTEWVISGGFRPAYFLEIRAATPNTGVYAGDFNASGNSFRFGSNIYTDVNLPYASSLETKDFDFDAPAAMKRGKWLGVDTVGAAVLTVTHKVNAVVGSSFPVNTDALSKTQKFIGPGYFRTWQLSVSAAGTVSFKLFGFVLFLHKKRSQIGASV